MDERVVKVEMEGGMSLEFSGREEEEEEEEEQVDNPCNLVKVRYIYFDVRNLDTDDNQQVIRVEEFLTPPMTERVVRGFLGHGLSPQELDNCMQQFRAVVDPLMRSRKRKGGGYRPRQLWFDVKRRGVVGTVYHELEIAMREEEEEECRNRMNRLLDNPGFLDGVLGNSHPNIGEDCPICLDDFGEREYATALPCLHHFHTHCIAHWLYRNNRCPICRCPSSSSLFS